jgi:serine/threonine protein kinase
MDEFDHEVQMVSSLRHPNIVLFMGVCFHQNYQLMITEFMAGKSVDTVLTKLTYTSKLRILKDIARGMTYLHSLDPIVIHRDLKLQNVLVCIVSPFLTF